MYSKHILALRPTAPARMLARFLFLFFFSVTAAWAQPTSLRFEHLTTENGLSHNNVRSVTQDRQGFIWVGTQSGLNRYDGYTFTVYRNTPDDVKSLSNSEVCGIFEDQAGRFWVGTFGGVNQLDRITGRFKRYPLGTAPHEAEPGACVFYQDQSGTLWLGTNVGLFHYDASLDQFVAYPDWGTGAAHAIGEAPDGALWVNKLQNEQLALYRIAPDRTLRQTILSTHPYQQLLFDPQGNLWLSGPTLVRFDTETGTVVSMPNAPSYQATLWMHQGHDGELWIGTMQDLHRFDLKTRSFTRYDINDRSNGLSDEIFAVHQDQAGIVWAGTPIGLYLGGPAAQPFRTNLVNQKDPVHTSEDPDDSIVVSISEDETGNYWISTYDQGVSRIGPNGKRRNYRHDPRDPESLCSDLVWKILKDQSGTLWFAGDQGVCQYVPSIDGFALKMGSPTPFLNIAEQADGTVWVSSKSALCRGPQNNAPPYCFPSEKTGGSVSHEGLDALWVDEEAVWTGGSGLNKLDLKTNVFTAYPLIDAEGQPIQSSIWMITKDTNGDLWLGTNVGLLHFDPETETYIQYGVSEGLAGTVVYSILQEPGGALWLGTSSGLSRFDPQTKTFRNFDTSDGVGSAEFNRHAVYKNKEGVFFFGGLKGITSFHPDEIQANTFVPPVLLTQIQASRREGIRHISPYALETLTLSHDDYTVSFEFAALNFVSPEKNQYAYQLEGLDPGWIQAGTRRFVSYTNIPPGTYTFKVKGSNNEGVWNEAGLALPVVVTPPFWQTLWFRLIAVALLGGLVVLAYRTRVQRLLDAQQLAHLAKEKQRSEAEARRLAELDAAKSRFFANISHEFRTPLTLIISPLEDTKNAPALPASIEKRDAGILRQAKRLLALINQLLDLSKIEAGQLTLNLQPGNLTAFVQARVRAFVPLAERKEIDLQFRTEEAKCLTTYDPKRLTTVLDNLLSNALKFTPKGGKVWVSLSLLTGQYNTRVSDLGDTVQILVKDTGPGISKEDLPLIFDRFVQINDSTTRTYEGTGIGLALARELTELHEGRLLVESEEGFGTTFIMQLPLRVVDAAGMPASKSDTLFDAHTPSAEPEDATPSFEASTVLVVEDHPEVRALLREQLGGVYHIREAGDGEAGLALARENPPDLILSDVMMPHMDGYALCRAVKTDPALQHIPVILLTAKADEESTVQGLETGADDYISKPFNPNTLRARMANLIAGRKHLHEVLGRSVQVGPAKVAVTSADEQFLEDVVGLIEAHLEDVNLSVDRLATLTGMSRRQLERRFRAVLDQTPAEFIRQFRLERARHLLAARAGTISEIAYRVGFKNPAYFSTLFKEAYGETPSTHQAKASPPIIKRDAGK